MTSRWRIRHKLLLGVALVVGVLALLLCGTLRGLWSYYLTTNTIRAKLHELHAAEELKIAVADLVSEDTLQIALVEGSTEKGKPYREAIRRAHLALDAYAEKLDDTLANNPDHGIYEKGLIERIREKIQTLEDEVTARMAGMRVGPGASDAKMVKNQVDALTIPCATLQLDTRDLRTAIKDSLDDSLGKTRGHYQKTLWIVVPASVIGLFSMIGLMLKFYSWVINPIRDLEKGVKSLAQGQFGHTLDVNSGDEMQDLAMAFNDMSRRLGELYGDLANQVNERSRQLVRSERLASVGFLAAGVAHEINNPLASIAFCAEALEARLNEMIRHLRANPKISEEHEVFTKYLRMIQEEAFRCKTITERLLEFSRTGEPRRDPTDLRGLVQAVLDVTQHLPNHKGKRILFEVPPERAGGRITAYVNAEEIKSVILNLVINALENMDEAGMLTIRLGQRDGLAELRFIDTGCGMSQEVQENLFEPFFTRSRSGKGTGLGLTITHLIISQHGGAIEASSPGVGLGSTFVVRLPVQPSEAVLQMTVGESTPPPIRLAA